MAGQFVPVKINAEKEGVAATKKYGVQGFPTILFLNASGSVEGKIVGYLDPAPFATQLHTIAEAHRVTPALEARLRAKPDDVEAAAKLAAIYAGRENEARAVALLEQAEKGNPQNPSLAKAYNAVGDHFQLKNDFDRAIGLFRKAEATGKDPYDVNYARISIASCYLSQQKPDQATPELEAILNDPHAPQEIKGDAQKLMDQLKKPSGG